MTVLLLILLIPMSFGSTSIEKEAKDLVERWKLPRTQCQEHVSAVLMKGYFVDDSAPDDQVAERFIKDEQKALKLMRSLDYKKITFRESSDYNKFLYKTCPSDFKSLKIPEDRCNYVFELFYFFKALVYSVNNYPWSKRTKDEAIMHIQKYLKVIGENQTDLFDKLLAISILKLSSELSLTSGNGKELIRELEVEAEKVNERFTKLNKELLEVEAERFKKLIKEYLKMDDERFSKLNEKEMKMAVERFKKYSKKWDQENRICSSAYSLLEEELAEAQRIGTRLLEVLGKVNYK